MDQDRSHRRVVWLIVGLLLVYGAGVVGYELNWIHQRRTAWGHSLMLLSSRPDRETPTQAQELPAPRGAGPLDKLAMWLCGEPNRGWVAVQNRGSDTVLSTFANGRFPDDVLEGLDDVRRARWLYPDEQIVVQYRAYGRTNVVTTWKADADRLLSIQPPAP